jgi:hypothetical protein
VERPFSAADAPDLYKIVLDSDYDTVRTAGETHVRGAGLRRVKDPAMYINGERIPYRKHVCAIHSMGHGPVSVVVRRTGC